MTLFGRFRHLAISVIENAAHHLPWQLVETICYALFGWGLGHLFGQSFYGIALLAALWGVTLIWVSRADARRPSLTRIVSHLLVFAAGVLSVMLFSQLIEGSAACAAVIDHPEANAGQFKYPFNVKGHIDGKKHCSETVQVQIWYRDIGKRFSKFEPLDEVSPFLQRTAEWMSSYISRDELGLIGPRIEVRALTSSAPSGVDALQQLPPPLKELNRASSVIVDIGAR
jgi:hypothetical protein